MQRVYSSTYLYHVNYTAIYISCIFQNHIFVLFLHKCLPCSCFKIFVFRQYVCDIFSIIDLFKKYWKNKFQYIFKTHTLKHIYNEFIKFNRKATISTLNGARNCSDSFYPIEFIWNTSQLPEALVYSLWNVAEERAIFIKLFLSPGNIFIKYKLPYHWKAPSYDSRNSRFLNKPVSPDF